MAMNARVISATIRLTASRVAQTSSQRHYSSKPYPFTKPGDPKPAANSTAPGTAPAKPYPFTSPTEPQQVPPANRPVDNPGPAIDESSMVSRQAEEDTGGPQPDYAATVSDYRISVYTPTPTRVMDGSEPTDTLPAAVLSGAPTELQARTVRIYRPSKQATQDGAWHEHHWQMDWDILHKGHRWENPLMGWQSSGDFMQGTKLNFASKEDAIRFAEKQGYEYFVQEPAESKFLPKAYATQFQHIPGPLKHIRTK